MTRDNRFAIVPWLLAFGLGLGWAGREYAHAADNRRLKAQTVNLADVKITDIIFDGTKRGEIGLYLQGETPSTRNIVVGHARLDPGQEPHPIHTHADEEVLVVTSGKGEIFCDGKKSEIGPGSVMYTSPNAPHGIKNTGSDALTFYFVKWVGVESQK